MVRRLTADRIVLFSLWNIGPIRGQYPGHMITLDQSEASVCGIVSAEGLLDYENRRELGFTLIKAGLDLNKYSISPLIGAPLRYL